MEIKKKSQLNQGIDQYKLLSTAAGVGALVSTKMKLFMMPLTIDEWGVIKRAQSHVEEYPDDPVSRIIRDEAVEILSDDRFVAFLKDKQKFKNLKYLVAIPQLQLSRDNYLKNDEQPLYKQYLKPRRIKPQDIWDYFNIPAILFPRWLFNPQTHKLATYEDWKRLWTGAGKQSFEFAPPKEIRDDKEERLRQMHLVLICENGHISDIPWDCFFAAYLKEKQGVYKSGFKLFDQNPNTCCNGQRHKLKYLENENHSDGWGRLVCEVCNECVPLDGIMNLRPECSKEMPWLGIDRGRIKVDAAACTVNNAPGTMRVALVTSHSTYYADTISSLYIPQLIQAQPDQEEATSESIQACLNWLNVAFSKSGDTDKQLFVEGFGGKTTLFSLAEGEFSNNGVSITSSDFDVAFDLFMNAPVESPDKMEGFRFEEYVEFTKPTPLQDPKLKITDVEIPSDLSEYFSKIRQVHTLCLTKTQLGFFRGRFRPPFRNGNQIVYPPSMSLSGQDKKDILVYPAIQEFGEGIFFELNREALEKWSSILGKEEGSRYSRRDYDSQAYLSLLLDGYGHADWFYLLHTFAHVIIKELEFSCGYPSDSLKERVYYSERMCGVLIYTVDGAEGGMGGLVWQGRKEIIETIVKKAIRRANLCSSDPICWQHTEDSLNYAACFSCAMISETSCEFGNNGLDRRALVDEKFGYFKKLLQEDSSKTND